MRPLDPKPRSGMPSGSGCGGLRTPSRRYRGGYVGAMGALAEVVLLPLQRSGNVSSTSSPDAHVDGELPHLNRVSNFVRWFLLYMFSASDDLCCTCVSMSDDFYYTCFLHPMFSVSNAHECEE